MCSPVADNVKDIPNCVNFKNPVRVNVNHRFIIYFRLKLNLAHSFLQVPNVEVMSK